ncbi:hypothetical protein ZWY2020_045829 [Hordeum vulgare]|nr:hypothetical protein ZWY2020_045829 [Hordeum vulgare]
MAPHLSWRLLQFLLLLLLGVSSAAQAQVNITRGSSLTPKGPTSSWLSPSGDFAFGFQQIEGNSSSYLLAVWFDKIHEKTVVWYAKSSSDSQESPVQVPSSSVLQLTADGLLSLRNPSGDVVWSPRVPGVAYARMLDTGNFMLVGADGTTKWETFDFPADTILPTQVLSVGQQDKVLRSRLIATDYSNGRFLLAVQTDGNLAFYPIAEPTTKRYDAYWTSGTDGNGSQLVFNETGRVYFTVKNGTQINITSASVTSMGDYFNRATLDPDGVFRQYLYPKSRQAARLWGLQWTAMSSIPQNICQVIMATNAGSGACGFNSYCSFDGTQNQTTICQCPDRYKFFDKERKYKGCRPDFEPQSCDLDEEAASAQFEMTQFDNVDWPLSDYEEYSPIDMTDCRRLCIIDCFCATAVFHASTNTCWKKKLPLSNGKMAESVDRIVLIKYSALRHLLRYLHNLQEETPVTATVRRNVELEVADEEQAILTYWANDCYRCGRIDLLVEGDDEANFNIKKAERFVAVALWCLQEEPTMRPTMLKVTQMLDGAVQIPTPPDPSSFISSLS